MKRRTVAPKNARTGSRLVLVPPGQRGAKACRVTSVTNGVLRCVIARSGEVFFINRMGTPVKWIDYEGLDD